jgi:DNA-binding winged helix-turn-helix (wHTH) protein
MIFAFGKCQLDTDRYELSRDGVPCHVEPQVLDLLLYFLKNPGRLVTKAEIFETIWEGRCVSDSALSARVSVLRRAIGDGCSEEGSLRTVFRRGFRFVGTVEIRESADKPASSRAYLCGQFVCYSYAWSPTFEGKLVRGSLVVEPPSGRSPLMQAVYSEALPGWLLCHRGPVTFSERTIYLDLADARADSRVLLTLLCPGPPATALIGVMSGKVFHDPNSEIAVTPFLAVRIPAGGEPILDGRQGYLDLSDESLSRDLGALGVPLSFSPVLDSVLEGFLAGKGQGSFFRVTAADNQAVNVALDRALADPR